MMGSLEMMFVDGKRKALTLSYDDGTIHDRKLVALMNQYGIKGTFNLNSGIFGTKEQKTVNGIDTDFSRIDAEEVKILYQGHEVASHTVTHPSLTGLPANLAAAEVLEDRSNLEELTGRPVRGFAYPFGTFNELVEEVLSACGIEYARTVNSTNDFTLPQEFLEWHPTCHHEAMELMELARKFCEEDAGQAKVFYLWGHSYEFAQKDNWNLIEDFFNYINKFRDEIWMASNIEIFDYVKAFGQLRCSTDNRVLYNPTDIRLWIEVDGKIYSVNGGEKLEL